MVSTDFEDFEPRTDRIEVGTLAQCPYFRVEKLTLSQPTPLENGGRFAIIAVLNGEVMCGNATFKAGDFFLVPASLVDGEIAPINGPAQILRSTLPT